MKKRIFSVVLVLVLSLCLLTGCNKADNIQYNISHQSDNFETYRRISVINLRSDAMLLQVEGYLSIKDSTETELAVIIQTAPNEYKMHYIYTGAEIVYLVEQLEPSNTDPYHWEIRVFATIPDVELG
jgi:hypothetical protein